jgi:hypothetical protein
LDLQLPVQSVPITTKVVSSLDTKVSFTNKNGHHNITEIMFKVVLNTMTLLTVNPYKNKDLKY